MASPTIVPDASVAAKWLLEDPGTLEARDLLVRFLDGEITLVAPSLLYYEVANAMRFSKAIGEEEADRFLGSLLGLGIEQVHPSESGLRRAAHLARRAGATVYDAVYWALAEERGGVVVTADADFQRRAKSRHAALLADVHAELGP